MLVTISRERTDSPEAMALIEELEHYIAPMYPHDRDHGLSPSRLAEEGVPFFIIRCDGEAVGCGAIKIFSDKYGEVMRMYVRPSSRGRGLGKMMLRHLEKYALEHGVKKVCLKTGIYQPEALGLYTGQGYATVSPFGTYKEHPLNIYYAKNLL